LEVAYLAKKAGWRVTVIDRKSPTPASGLGDQSVQLDIASTKDLGWAFKGMDLVIPALENEHALQALGEWSHRADIPVIFDFSAHEISSSKIKSNEIFHRNNIPMPRLYPECGLPVVVKPDRGSGSQGVKIIHTREAYQEFIKTSPQDQVLQAFISGPSYSIEIVGLPGKYHPLQITELHMDSGFDCKRVMAPATLSPRLASVFEALAEKLAGALELKGLMDVEVILYEDALKVLEIDARFPSQTPIVVYWSTGINMLEILADLFTDKDGAEQTKAPSPKGVVLEHVQVTPNTLMVSGEHIISGVRSLRLKREFFGADEAITNHAENRDEWVATLIISDQNREAAWGKRNAVIDDIRRYYNISTYLDLSPDLTSQESY
jgi:pyrrolysine biosynthesis protein PylC